jgi:hypothetical protein
MKSKISLIIAIINCLILFIYWVVIELDVKFSFGPERSEYIFNQGQELSWKSSIFISISIILNLFILLLNIKAFKKVKSEN